MFDITLNNTHLQKHSIYGFACYEMPNFIDIHTAFTFIVNFPIFIKVSQLQHFIDLYLSHSFLHHFHCYLELIACYVAIAIAIKYTLTSKQNTKAIINKNKQAWARYKRKCYSIKLNVCCMIIYTVAKDVL